MASTTCRGLRLWQAVSRYTGLLFPFDSMGKSALIFSTSIGHENQDERISILLADRFRYVRWKLYPGISSNICRSKSQDRRRQVDEERRWDEKGARPAAAAVACIAR